MKYYFGIVEDRQDPLKIGRVRVRIIHDHTWKKGLISTPDLPWADVILPTTSAGLSGFGTQHGLVEGSEVLVWFKDEPLNQKPVVMGSTVGILEKYYREDSEGKTEDRRVDQGFSDPRRLTVDDYDGTNDGKNPEHRPERGFGLTTALDTAPKYIKKREINYFGSGSKIEEVELTKDDLPYYPKKEYIGKSGLSPLATQDEDLWSYDDRNIPTVLSTLVSPPNVKTPAKPKYPYNKVIQTESGHIVELDDTLGAERIAVEHRSGTFQEIHPDGSNVTRVVNDNYTIICKDDELFVGGNVTVNVSGDATVTAIGNVDVKSYSDMKVSSTGTMEIKAGSVMTLSAPEEIKLRTPLFNPNGGS